jgi:hypothetical protein
MASVRAALRSAGNAIEKEISSELEGVYLDDNRLGDRFHCKKGSSDFDDGC